MVMVNELEVLRNLGLRSWAAMSLPFSGLLLVEEVKPDG